MGSEQPLSQTDGGSNPTPMTDDVSRSTPAPALDTNIGDGLTADMQPPDFDSLEDYTVCDETDSQLDSDKPMSHDTQLGSASVHSPDDVVVDAYADTMQDCVTTGTSDAPVQNDVAVEITDAFISDDAIVRSEPTDSNSTPAHNTVTVRRGPTRSRVNGANDQKKKGHTRSQYSMTPGRRPPDWWM